MEAQGYRMGCKQGIWRRIASFMLGVLTAGIAAGQVPSLEWLQVIGDGTFYPPVDGSDSIAADAAGNVYSVGRAYDAATVDEQPYLQFGFSGYLAKHAPDGSHEWVVRYPAQMGGVAVDSAGNVYAAGKPFFVAFDLDPGDGTWIIEGDDLALFFVVKFSSAGELLWAWTPLETGPPGYPLIGPVSLAVDAHDALFVTGMFHGTFEFGPNLGDNRLSKPLNPNGGADNRETFVCKLDAGGSLQWARQTASVRNMGANPPISVVLSETGNPIVTGFSYSYLMFGTADTDTDLFPPFEAHEGVYTLPQGANRFHFALDSATGDVQWALPLHENHVNYSDHADGPGHFNVMDVDRDGPNSLVIGKFDPYGSLYWSFALQETDWTIPGRTRLAADSRGNVYASIFPLNPHIFPAGLHTDAFELGQGGVLFKLGPGGVMEWAYPLELVPSAQLMVPIAADGLGGVYATGTFRYEGDFGGWGDEVFVETGPYDTIYTLKLSDIPRIPGDVNGDGVVNALDVQLVINAALGLPVNPGFRADINGDGRVDAVDVQFVINVALGIDPLPGEPALPAIAPPAAKQPEANSNYPIAPPGTPVATPGALVLLVLGFGACVFRRARTAA
jgi:outer membrane protein assembly factor BamB